MQILFEIISAASYGSAILTLRLCQKDRLVLIFFDFETQFFAKIQVQNSAQDLIWINPTRSELFLKRWTKFVPRIRSLIFKKL